MQSKKVFEEQDDEYPFGVVGYRHQINATHDAVIISTTIQINTLIQKRRVSTSTYLCGFVSTSVKAWFSSSYIADMDLHLIEKRGGSHTSVFRQQLRRDLLARGFFSLSGWDG